MDCIFFLQIFGPEPPDDSPMDCLFFDWPGPDDRAMDCIFLSRFSDRTVPPIIVCFVWPAGGGPVGSGKDCTFF